MKRKLWWQLAGVGVLALLLAANVIPWRQLDDGLQPSDFMDTLRPGIDLAGGTRLIYRVQMEPGLAGGQSPAQAMIETLKRRVDPNNTLNLIWRPIGQDMIEIIIPRATISSVRQRQAYDEARERLLAVDVRLSDIEQARLANSPEARKEAFLALDRGVSARRELLEQLWQAHEAVLAFEGVTTRPDMAMRQITQAYDSARDAVLRTNINLLDLDQVLAMGKKMRERQPTDPKTKKPVGPAPLQALLDRYPDRVELIEQTVAAYDNWRQERQALDNAEDLKRVLSGTGMLEFHIAVRPNDLAPDQINQFQAELQRGLFNVAGGSFRWLESADQKATEGGGVIHGDRFGTPYILVHNTPDKTMKHSTDQEWRFRSARANRDNLNTPIVEFQFDDAGGQRFAMLTGNNVGQPLAAVLDGKIISIATIRERISSRGQISGRFSDEQARELAQKMRAGALRGSLSPQPISEDQIGPQLGEAYARAGLYAAGIAVALVIAFMVVYYLFPLGALAGIAVVLNLIFILGLMAKGSVLPFPGFTFTLPGIAALALTIGMAVDANVLIFERIREEQDAGSPLRSAVKNGYGKALSAILDGNITTLITTLILFAVGTAEIKGFAIVLAIGIVCSMFTAIIVTRILLQLGIEYGLFKGKLPMLRLIRVPRIRWIEKRFAFWAVSAVLVVGGLTVFVATPWQDLYDVEFTGGTKAQFTLAEGRSPSDAQMQELIRNRVPDASVTTVLVQDAENARAMFQITTNDPNMNREGLTAALVDVLQNHERYGGQFGPGPLLPDRAVLEFDYKEEWRQLLENNRADVRSPNVHIVRDRFIDREGLRGVDLRDYTGGVAIHVTGLTPVPLDELNRRIRGRLESGIGEFRGAANWRLFGLEQEPGKGYTSVLFVAKEEQVPAGPDEQSMFYDTLAGSQIRLLYESLASEDVLDSVTAIHSSVASDAKVRAVLALLGSLLLVVIYVWIRFGNVLFGIGAILPLFHDVAITVGLVAASGWIVSHIPWLASALMIQNFRFDLTVVAAVLTIIGYSLNDTIVVFDRIRENRGRLNYVNGRIINDSLNQTMSRTLLTSLTTVLAILIMYVLGGQGVHGFAFAMLIGLVVGSYSSIAVASPVLLGWRRMMARAGGVAEQPQPAKP